MVEERYARTTSYMCTPTSCRLRKTDVALSRAVANNVFWSAALCARFCYCIRAAVAHIGGLSAQLQHRSLNAHWPKHPSLSRGPAPLARFGLVCACVGFGS